MEKVYILNKSDSIDVRGISFKNFIKIHQLLEDSGNSMYQTTKNRIKDGSVYWNYLYHQEGAIAGGLNSFSDNKIPYQEILNLIDNKTPQYEIY